MTIDNNLWVFGYGSLCWHPGFDYGDQVKKKNYSKSSVVSSITIKTNRQLNKIDLNFSMIDVVAVAGDRPHQWIRSKVLAGQHNA
jgi:hypothetical protein